MSLSLVIFAAGMGSRYGGLKQLDELGPCGETVMDYAVFDAVRAGFDRVIFVIRRDIEEAFRASVGSRYANRIRVDYAFQELTDLPGGHTVPEGRTKPWGTGQALYAARALLDGPFAAVNADDFYGFDTFRQLADALKKPDEGELGYIASFVLENTLSENGSVSRGLCEVKDARLSTVTEHTKIYRAADGRIVSEQPDGSLLPMTGKEAVSMNAWGFRYRMMDSLEALFTRFLTERGTELKSEFYLPFAVDTLIREKGAVVRQLSTASRWFGVTYKEDKLLVRQSLRDLAEAGQYPAKLW